MADQAGAEAWPGGAKSLRGRRSSSNSRAREMTEKKTRKPLITLYTPGHRRDLVEKAAKYGPDAVIIDLEDAVPLHLKERTRGEVAEYIPFLKVQFFVRVNSEPEFLRDDLEAVVSKHILGITLPKPDSVDLVKYADDIIGSLERERNLEPNSVKLMLLMETALSVLRCFEVATAAKRVESVVFGGAEGADLQRNLKCAWSLEGTEMLFARSKVVLEARAAGVKYVLDGVFSDIQNDEALRADCILSKRLGYDGRPLIHPRHIPIARGAYAPKPEEIDYSRRLVSAFEEAVAKGLAAISFEGKLVDYAMYKSAKDMLST